MPTKTHTGCHAHKHSEAGPQLDRALTQLKDSGLKLTQPRRALLEAIAESDGPFTTEEIFKSLRKTSQKIMTRKITTQKAAANAKCDLVTVYRSLSTFADLAILSKVDFGDGILRYEWADAQGHHHHHIVCNGCGSVAPLNLCEIEAQEKALEAAGYKQLTHRLEFFGLCPACAS